MKKWLFHLSAAAAGTLLPPFIAGIAVTWEAARESGAGPLDDAPVRAAYALFIPSPVLFAAAMVYFGAVVTMFRNRGRLTLGSMILANVAASVAVGAYFALMGGNGFDWKDTVLTFWYFTASAMTCLTCGAVAWWGANRSARPSTPRRLPPRGVEGHEG